MEETPGRGAIAETKERAGMPGKAVGKAGREA